MGTRPIQERSLKFILCERGVSEKDIERVLSKLDSKEYFLNKCHYSTRILSNDSETIAREIFINHYFSQNMREVSSDSDFDDLFQECIYKRKLWNLLKENFGAICIKLTDASLKDGTYLFVYGPNKKCPEINNTDSFVRFFPNESKDTKKQNPLEMSSLRLDG